MWQRIGLDSYLLIVVPQRISLKGLFFHGILLLCDFPCWISPLSWTHYPRHAFSGDENGMDFWASDYASRHVIRQTTCSQLRFSYTWLWKSTLTHVKHRANSGTNPIQHSSSDAALPVGHAFVPLPQGGIATALVLERAELGPQKALCKDEKSVQFLDLYSIGIK